MLVGDIAGRQCWDVDKLFEFFCPLFFRNVVDDNDAITMRHQHVHGLRSLPIAILAITVECFKIKNIVTCKHLRLHYENFDRIQTFFAEVKQSYEICLAAVKQRGRGLEFVNEQTPEICLAAVEQNGNALEFVKEQTSEICLTAVQQNGYAVRYVKKQTPDMCLAAVQQYGLVLQFVKEQTPKICMVAVKRYGQALQFVKEQTSEICMAACDQNPEAFRYLSKQMRERWLNA